MSSTRLRVASYDIAHQEDGPCLYCGWDQDQGEEAFELRDTHDDEVVEAGFCCRGCARRWAGDRDYRVVA